MRRREGARVRRERRQRAEARLRLRLVRDAAMLVAHRGGPRFDSQSKFVKEAVPEPVLVSRLLEPSSGVVGPFTSIFMSLLSHLRLVLLRCLVMCSGINLSRWKS